ncbi:histidine kinase [Knoellia sinensis KCTC 19936]|uniref:histidine kinase n=1 Tax=Knoellia sinensis KCTC 19936 TaxID=1385520 RepID=A0A0A0J9K6_9MICO|nr:sensor histidine kinase [Knoellia sinensis]KGN33828.1 histidine kinase [Knoellia sinensis KCTC 19936]
MRLYDELKRHGDVVVAVGLAAVMVAEFSALGGDAGKPVALVLGLLAGLSLALRRRSAFLGFLTTMTLLGALLWLVGHQVTESMAVLAVLFISLYSVGAHTTGRLVWVSAGLVLVGIVLFVASDGDRLKYVDVLFGGAIVGGPFAAGVAMRLRRDRESELSAQKVDLERERDAVTKQAVTEERARIARELHDVVAHAISVTVLQARGGRRMLDEDLDESRRAFDAIEHTNAQALADMRRLLQLLRDTDTRADSEPQPSLSRVTDLTETMRTSGVTVALEVTGDPSALPPGLDATAYRIVQEALTNVAKHANEAQAWVSLTYGAEELWLTVRDNGTHSGVTGARTTAGHGLVGIRERVAVAGGEVEVGPQPEGGFLVRARIPYAVTS